MLMSVLNIYTGEWMLLLIFPIGPPKDLLPGERQILMISWVFMQNPSLMWLKWNGYHIILTFIYKRPPPSHNSLSAHDINSYEVCTCKNPSTTPTYHSQKSTDDAHDVFVSRNYLFLCDNTFASNTVRPVWVFLSVKGYFF